MKLTQWLAVALAAWTMMAAPVRAMSVTETAVHVQVDGAVRKPGLYRVAAGGRLADAIAAAGGPLPGAQLATLNLAARATDGEHLHVPARAEPVPVKRVKMKVVKRKGLKRPVTPVDLNSATAAQLDTLPGVGPSMIGRILAVRKRLGRFHEIDELREVPGIGAKRLAKLRPLVVIR